MESCSSKLDKIKFTIEEIKGDMEKMKIKNEQTLNEMMNSMDINEKIINTINMIEETNNNSIESDKETKEDLIRKYDTYELSEEKNEPKLIDISDNNMSNTISENNSTYDYKGSNANYQKMTIKYQTEIAKLKAKMASMIKDNEEISARLERERLGRTAGRIPAGKEGWPQRERSRATGKPAGRSALHAGALPKGWRS